MTMAVAMCFFTRDPGGNILAISSNKKKTRNKTKQALLNFKRRAASQSMRNGVGDLLQPHLANQSLPPQHNTERY